MLRPAGTNACYMEQLGNITKWLPHYRPRTPDMVVNIEWPGFQVSVCHFGLESRFIQGSPQLCPSPEQIFPWTVWHAVTC